VPPERLHFFDVKDGWEPLCKILSVPVPNEPFPRVNEKAAMKELGYAIMRYICVRWRVILGVVMVIVVGILLEGVRDIPFSIIRGCKW
jgi:hypothetical protein